MRRVSLRERNKEVPKKRFFGREFFINEFNKSLEAVDKQEYCLLSYTGSGGIGKSSLLKTLKENVLEDSQNIVSFIDFDFGGSISSDREQIASFYAELKKQIGKNVKFLYFDAAFQIYWSRLKPNTPLQESGIPFLEESSLILDSLGLIEKIAFLGAGGSLLNVVNKANYYTNQIKKRLNKEYSEDLEEFAKIDEISEMQKYLSSFFLYDIKEHLKKNPSQKFIYFFDTYEVLWEQDKQEIRKESYDEWIKYLILDLKECRSLFVVAGREIQQFNYEFEELQEYTKEYELSKFSEHESMEYLQLSGIKENDIVEKIIDVSEGIPFYLNLLVETYERIENPKLEDFDYDKNNKIKLFEKFFKYLSKEESSAIKVLCVGKSFDFELYKALIANQFIQLTVTDWNSICGFSFISTQNGDRYYMHNLMKEAILHDLDSDIKLKVSEFLFEYYENILKTKANGSKEWSDVFKTAIYYRFQSLNEVSSYSWFSTVIEVYKKTTNIDQIDLLFEYIDKYATESYVRFKIKYARALLLLESDYKIKRVSELMKEIKQIPQSDKLRAEFHYLSGTYNLTLYDITKNKREYANAKDLLEKALKFVNDDELETKILIGLANLHRKKSKSKTLKMDKSIGFLKRAYSLNNDLETKAKIYDKLGVAHLGLKQYPKALYYFLKSLKIRKSILGDKHLETATSYRNTANLYNKANKPHKSIYYINKAIEIHKNVLGMNSLKTIYCYDLAADIYIKLDNEDELLNVSDGVKLNVIKKLLKNTNDVYSLLEMYKLEDNHLLYKLAKILYPRNKEKSLMILLDYIEFKEFDRYENYKTCINFYKELKDISAEEKYLIKLESYCEQNSNNRSYLIFTYINLCDIYKGSEKEKYYLNKLLEQYDEEPYKKSQIYQKLSNYYINIENDAESALENLKQKLDLLSTTKSVSHISDAISSLISFYNSQKMYDTKLFYLKELEKLWMQKQNYEKLLEVYGYFAKYYHSSEDSVKELEYIKLQLEYAKKIISKYSSKRYLLDRQYGYFAEYYEYRKKSSCEYYYLLKQFKVRVKYDFGIYKINQAYRALIYFCRNNENLKKELFYLNSMVDFNLKNDNKQELKFIYSDLSFYYKKTNDKEKTLEYLKKRLDVLKEFSDRDEIHGAYRLLSSFYRQNRLYDDEEMCLKEQIKLFKGSKNYQEQRKSYEILGRFYNYHHRKDEELKYLFMEINFYRQNALSLTRYDYIAKRIMTLIKRDRRYLQHNILKRLVFIGKRFKNNELLKDLYEQLIKILYSFGEAKEAHEYKNEMKEYYESSSIY